MQRPKVFVSYSHSDKGFRDELVPVLQAVPGIGEVLWFDEQDVTIGDEFHPKIQQALAASSLGILLLSNRFFTSNYIKRHELPYLLQRARGKTLKIAPLYVTTIPDGAFKVTIEVDGQQKPVNLQGLLGSAQSQRAAKYPQSRRTGQNLRTPRRLGGATACRDDERSAAPDRPALRAGHQPACL